MTDETVTADSLKRLLDQRWGEVGAAKVLEIRARLGDRTTAVIVGAGALGAIVLSRLREIGIPCVAFADNDASRWGTERDGVPVLSPDEAVATHAIDSIWVIAVYTNSPVRAQCKALGVSYVTLPELAWVYPGHLLPFYAVDGPDRVLEASADVLAAAGLWADDVSLREYVGSDPLAPVARLRCSACARGSC